MKVVPTLRLDAKAEERNVEGAAEGTVHTGRETGRVGKEGLEKQNKIYEIETGGGTHSLSDLRRSEGADG